MLLWSKEEARRQCHEEPNCAATPPRQRSSEEHGPQHHPWDTSGHTQVTRKRFPVPDGGGDVVVVWSQAFAYLFSAYHAIITQASRNSQWRSNRADQEREQCDATVHERI